MSKRFPMPMPFGWFAVSYADELAVGESKPVRYFGQDLVLFRTESGKPVLMEAYCPHLGAHLGYGIHENTGHGGRIEGETIVCPFHAWKFNAAGECTEVPYAKNTPPKIQGKQCLKSFPICETNQMIYAWYHPADVTPLWEVEAYEECNSNDWAPYERYEWTMNTVCQEIAENSVDAAHFFYVHRTGGMPNSDINYDGFEAWGINKVTLNTPKGDVNGAISFRNIGPGIGRVKFEGIAETFLINSITPIDDEHVHVRFAFTQPKVNGEVVKGGVNAAIIADIKGQLDEDMPIWEHKIYRDSPILCDGDGPIARFRRYYRQFYAALDAGSTEQKSAA